MYNALLQSWMKCYPCSELIPELARADGQRLDLPLHHTEPWCRPAKLPCEDIANNQRVSLLACGCALCNFFGRHGTLVIEIRNNWFHTKDAFDTNHVIPWLRSALPVQGVTARAFAEHCCPRACRYGGCA